MSGLLCNVLANFTLLEQEVLGLSRATNFGQMGCILLRPLNICCHVVFEHVDRGVAFSEDGLSTFTRHSSQLSFQSRLAGLAMELEDSFSE